MSFYEMQTSFLSIVHEFPNQLYTSLKINCTRVSKSIVHGFQNNLYMNFHCMRVSCQIYMSFVSITEVFCPAMSPNLLSISPDFHAWYTSQETSVQIECQYVDVISRHLIGAYDIWYTHVTFVYSWFVSQSDVKLFCTTIRKHLQTISW